MLTYYRANRGNPHHSGNIRSSRMIWRAGLASDRQGCQ
jgi:hypothetical protein